MATAAERCAAMDGGPDDPSFNDLAQIIGPECDFRLPDVGGLTGAEALNLAMYWPALPPGYETPQPRACAGSGE